MSAQRTTLVVVVSDLHVNSTIGLCPSRVTLDDRGEYVASKAQSGYLLRNWRRFWNDVEALKASSRAERVIVALAGDAVDDNRHSKAQLITVNRGTIVDLAEKVLELAIELADELLVVRGTEAHVGGSGELEELAARRIGATPDPVTGLSSSWSLLVEIEGVLFDIAHHPPTAGYRPYTRAPAAARAAFILRSQYQEEGTRVPDVAIRGHTHYYQPGPREPKPEFFYCPPWQLCTAFGHRLGGGRIEPVGGLTFVCRGGSYQFKALRYRPPRVRPWQL